MKLIDLRASDRVFVDGGFTCMDAGEKSVYACNEDGDLYVHCSHGHHSLQGQENENGDLVGIHDPKTIMVVTLFSAVSDHGDGSYSTKLFNHETHAEELKQYELDNYGQACMESVNKHVLFISKDGILLNPDKVKNV